MVEYHHEESARTTGWVEHTGILVRIHHLHHTFDDVAWREELTSFLLQRITDDGLVCCALHIDSSVEERVFGKFAGNIGESTVGKSNLFTAVKHILKHMALFQILKDALDTGSYSCLSFLGILLLHAHPETTAVTDTFFGIRKTALLIIELAEDKVEQFPESRFLHAFISVDIVMATLECLHERLVGWLTRHSTLSLRFEVGKRLSLTGEVGDSFASHLTKVILTGMNILQIFTVCPTSKLAVGCAKNVISSGFHASLFVIGLHLGILGNNDKTDKFIGVMGMPGVENCQVHLLRLGFAAVLILILHLEVTLHVF